MDEPLEERGVLGGGICAALRCGGIILLATIFRRRGEG